MPQDVNGNRQENVGGAPALEKGLDLIEVLAAEPGGLTQKQVAERVGRSASEIFRMLGVLHRRGYIARDARSGEYSLTLRLFELAMRHPPTQRLRYVAQPVMERLAMETGLSCHLGMQTSETEFLIVATAAPPAPMGWVVKLGGTFPFDLPYTSARVLAAFQAPARRAETIRLLAARAGQAEAAVRERLDTISAAGHDRAGSEIAIGLTDLCYPILDEQGVAFAALTLPFLPWISKASDPLEVIPALRAAAGEISARLAPGG